MILLDTNVLSELMRPQPNPDVVTWLNNRPTQTLFISTITIAEIELGIALLPDGRRKRDLENAAKQSFKLFGERCLNFNQAAAHQYAQLVAGRTEIGRPISVEDALIIAIALANGLHLATRNIKDFQDTKQLSVVNPWEA